MEQYVKYLRKSRFDRDYAELSIEETLKRHEAILDNITNDRGKADSVKEANWSRSRKDVPDTPTRLFLT